MSESYHNGEVPQWPIRPGQRLPPLPLAMRAEVAAKAIGVSPRTLWGMAKRGEIPSARLGGCVVYPTAAILAWLAEITVNPPVKRPPAADDEGGVR